MNSVSVISTPRPGAGDSPLLPYTRAFEWLLRIIFALAPSSAIAYLYFLGNPALRFIDYGFHEIAIALAVALGAFVSYVTWRCYRHSGEPFLRWLAQGMTGFTVVYLPHGMLTRTADCNLWRFLLYGPASRLVMVCCLAVALFRYGAPADSPEQRGSATPLWHGLLVFALVDLVVAMATQQPVLYGFWLRLVLEGGALFLALLCIVAMLWRGLWSSPLMQLYLLAMAFFAQSSFSFFLARPWDHQWWLAHGIFAGGFLILSYGVIRAFHTTRAFASVYSQEEMMRRLEFANAELERLAATDSLTGATNRRHFLQRADEELARSRRSGEPLSLLMMDIDFFKAVNDQHGHPAGDATLIAFVDRAREILRLADVLGRIGGEEFSAMLVGSSSTQAASIAERIRAAMAATPIEVAGATLHVTVSIGVAEFGVDGDSVGSVLKAADERLYRAKAGGRNRVVH